MTVILPVVEGNMVIDTTFGQVLVEAGKQYDVVLCYQYYENYGAHDWDGEGECPQHWKAKGSWDEKFVWSMESGIHPEYDIVRPFSYKNVESTDYSRRTYIGWDIVERGAA
jgi:hypothetical protein